MRCLGTIWVAMLTATVLTSARGRAWAQVGPPPVILIQPASQSASVGAPVTFTVTAASITRTTYKWRFNGNSLPAANDAFYTIASVQPGDVGNYSVEVKNNGGTVISSNAVLSISTPIRIVATDWSSNGFTLRVTAPIAQACVTLASSNLVAWTPLATNVALLGSFSVTDPAAARLPQRFYRVLGQ